MHTYISMLRGINVSGQKKIAMAELSRLYQSLGLVDVRTYVQSGNVIFHSSETGVARLSTLIETQIQHSLGYSLPVFIRDPKDFQRILTNSPFLSRGEDPTSLHVTFLYRSPEESNWGRLTLPKDDSDEFIVGDQEIFLFCPNGYGKTKLSNAFFERKLQVPATTRNWKTVNAIHQMAMEMP